MMRHTMIRTHTAALATATLLLTGCGSSGGPEQPATLEQMAEQIGCTGYEPDRVDMVPFATGYGTCEVAGGFVQLYSFPNQDAVGAFWDTVTALGADPDNAASVGLMVAYSDDPAALAQIRGALR